MPSPSATPPLTPPLSSTRGLSPTGHERLRGEACTRQQVGGGLCPAPTARAYNLRKAGDSPGGRESRGPLTCTLTCTLWCCTSSRQGSQTCRRPHGSSWPSSACHRSASRPCHPSPPRSPLSQGCAFGRRRGWLGSGCLPPGCSGSGEGEEAPKGTGYFPVWPGRGAGRHPACLPPPPRHCRGLQGLPVGAQHEASGIKLYVWEGVELQR